MTGKFITVEGTDGAGKTTQINLLTEYLKNRGYEVLLTREPGGTAIGEKIRELLLDCDNSEMFSITEVLLYVASRVQHLNEKILPAVKNGKIVICDRFVDSSIAYQGFGRELGIDMIESINALAMGNVSPDITFYLDIDPVSGIHRKKQELGHTLDRMEQEKLDFHKRVSQGYKFLCEHYTERIKKIDAGKNIQEVHNQIIEELQKVL